MGVRSCFVRGVGPWLDLCDDDEVGNERLRAMCIMTIMMMVVVVTWELFFLLDRKGWDRWARVTMDGLYSTTVRDDWEGC